jgi:hypothetical protein
MKKINRTSIILFMVVFFMSVNQSNAAEFNSDFFRYPLLAQLAGMIYYGGEEGVKAVCCNSKDDNRTFAKQFVDVTTHAAAYSFTFAGYHYIQIALEAEGVEEGTSKRAAVSLSVLAGGAMSAAANKLGDLMLYYLPCYSITNERQPSSDEEVQLEDQ